MTKRNKKQYKLINFYKEDLWGKLGHNVYKLTKPNSILLEKSVDKFKFSVEIQLIKERLKDFYNLKRFDFREKKNEIMYKLKNLQQKNYLRKNLLNELNLIKQQEKKQRKLRLITYKKYQKAVKENIKLLKDTRIKPSFNFRIDIGKPKRKLKQLSAFSKKLKNRHKLRKFYSSTINTKQLRNYVRKVHHYCSLSLFFFRILESRLDSFIFRLNLCYNSSQIRQLINHGNFLINGRLVFFSNIRLNLYDVFSVVDKKFFFFNFLKENKIPIFSIPRYLEVNFRIMSAIMFRNPLPKHIYYPTKSSILYLASPGYKFRKR